MATRLSYGHGAVIYLAHMVFCGSFSIRATLRDGGRRQVAGYRCTVTRIFVDRVGRYGHR